MKKGWYDLALENYLSALEWSEKKGDAQYRAIVQHNIALLKRRIGKYEEAKSLFKKALSFEASKKWGSINDTLSYLTTLSDLIDTYRKNKEIDSALTLNKKGIELSKGLDIQNIFFLNKGVIQYYQKEYDSSISNINRAIDGYHKQEKKWYFEGSNFVTAYLHLGKSYEAIADKQEAINNFEKVDSISSTENSFVPEVITAHKELVHHYKSIGDRTNQLKYIDKLLKSDSILTSNYKIVGNQLFKEFDTKELIREKEEVIASLEQENSAISHKNVVILILLLISIGIAGFYFYRQRLYKKRFLKLVADQSGNAAQKAPDKNTTTSISEETIQHLLQCLQNFEDNQEYLNPDINMIDLAKRFDSNSNYLSKVINRYKGKNFTQYINDLRVDYVINKLKKDPIFRKYTVLALAQEIGFKNPESFSKAFYKQTGIYPSYFIKELLKQ